MLYNLPTGKVIELSVEQYLELTDEELEYLISINYGESIENPFFGSILSKPVIIECNLEEIPPPALIVIVVEEDNSIDYTPDKEE